MSEWIDVKDEMPPETTIVLVWLPLEEEFGLRTLGYFFNGIWYSGTKPFKKEVTHWVSLPDPPLPSPPTK